MGDIFSYLENYNDISFKEHPFNAVDALVLSQFIYLKWEHVIPLITEGKESISILEMSRTMQEAEVFSYDKFAEDNRRMFALMLSGRRFATIKCNYLSNTLDDGIETQFCAITAFPEDALPIVVFRGTDETLLGWKEDYNMTSDAPVTGQRMASLYLKRAALRLPEHFNIAGHSKGGNLAVYSAFSAPKDVSNRIDTIYNFDGPHFRKEILEQFDYNTVADKVEKFIPKSSVVGILLETEHKYKVVDSPALLGSVQHSPFKWEVEDSDFVYVDKVDNASLNMNEKIMRALYTLSAEEVRMVGEVLFDVLYGSEVTTTQDISKSKRKSAMGMFSTFKGMDSDIKEELWSIIKEFKKV